MESLIEQIGRIQDLILQDKRTEAEQNEVDTMILRLASHLDSPSKLNAWSVLKSNSAEKLANWLSYYEGIR